MNPMNTPSDRSALFVKEDGLIYLIENLPIEPVYGKFVHHDKDNLRKDLEYKKALASAKQSAIRVEDQEQAKRILYEYEGFEMGPGIYPIPGLKWKRINYCTANCCPGEKCLHPEWRAEILPGSVLSPSSIEGKSENQEDIWNDVFQNYMIWQDQEPKLSDLLKDFQISRR